MHFFQSELVFIFKGIKTDLSRFKPIFFSFEIYQFRIFIAFIPFLLFLILHP